MSVIEHLEELRSRLIVSLIALAAGTTVGWIFYSFLFRVAVQHPYCRALRSIPKEIVPPTGCHLVFTGVVEPFLIRFKISVAAGFALALPVLLYELWRFITPGLTRRERRLSLPFVGASLVLFALGGWFAYLTLSKGLRFLLSFAGNTIVPLLTVDKFISFLLFLLLAFGLSFEFPLVLIMLQWVGVLSSRRLRNFRRWAWLGITVFAAVITPSQDPYTQLAMMVPMILFYELSILIGRAMKR
ncbi:MAG: twin-arginine translocase subunit TatC [Actinomycetota bacterium]